MSKKHAAQLRIYSQKRKQFLAANPKCEIVVEGCTHYATQVHHSERRGPNLNR